MYSELSQQLNRIELESLTDSLDVAVTTHLNWLSNVNKALVCNDAGALHMCPEGESYKRCQFGRWYYKVTNKILLEDPSFQELGALHKDMHIKVFELVNRLKNAQTITLDSYQKFIDLQSDFFMVLNSLAKDSTESLGNIDFLTGLPNRRAFHMTIAMERNRIKRTNKTSFIAIADIDHFKKINDTYGHDAGDKILIQVAGIFRSTIREYDTVSRFGGEEFIFCLPEINASGANDVVERVRLCIEERMFDIDADEEIQLTCSFGMSQFNRNISTEKAISLADDSLYRAKASGRNMVVHHELADI